MTICNLEVVTEIYLLEKRPWRYNPLLTWKICKRFEKDFGSSFTSYASAHWLGRTSREIDPSSLHNSWTFHVFELKAGGMRVFILPKSHYSMFLDDITDGLIQLRFP